MSGRRRPDLPDPHLVLAGREPIRIEDLFQLIHAVNPTERGLARNEEAEAYALKARLQSLLIERFGEQLVVQEVAGAGEVIGLRHRTYQKDACHAMLRQLSAKAQSWVRSQRDLGEAPAEAPRAVSTGAGVEPVATAAAWEDVDAQLDRGEAMLAEYDFEAARQLFHASLARCTVPELGAPRLRAARSLLQLLVDQLGDDARALELRPELDAGVMADGEVRSLMALAAARSGDPDWAATLIAGIDNERVHLVWIRLAELALDKGDLDGCSALLRHVPSDSSHRSDALRIVAEVQARRVAKAGPLELELASAVRQGERERAEAIAQQVLALNGESATAREVMRRRRQAQQTAATLALLAAIDGSLESRALRVARTLLLQLPEDCSERAARAMRLGELEADEQAASQQASIDALVHHLEAGITPELVESLWAADAAVLAAVQRRVRAPAAGWLFEFEAGKGRAHCVAAAAAALAMAHAEALHAGGDPAAALAAASPHEATVRASERGRALLQQLRRIDVSSRRQLAVSRLADAVAAASSDPRAALDALAGIDEGWLDEADRNRLHAVHDDCARACAEGDAMLRLQHARDGRDLFAARTAARELAAIAGPSTVAARRAELSIAERQLREAWMEVDATDDQPLHDLLPRPQGRCRYRPALALADGIVTASQRAGRVFVRVLRLAHGHSRSFVLRPPEPFDLQHVHVEGQMLWLVGRQSILQLDLDSGELIDRKRLADLQGINEIECALPLSGGRKIWVLSAGGVWLVDRHHWQVERRIEDCLGLYPLWGGVDAAVVYSRYLSDVVRSDDRGLHAFRMRGSYVLHCAAAHPSGQGAMLLRADCSEQLAGSGPTLCVSNLLPNGRGYGDLELGRVNGDSYGQMVTSGPHGCVFVTCEFLEAGRQLIAVVANEKGIAILWRESIAGAVELFSEAASRAAYALIDVGGEVRLLQLTEQPPGLGRADEPYERLPDLEPHWGCEWPDGELRLRIEAYRALLPLLEPADQTRRIAGLLAGEPDLTTLLGLKCSGCDAEHDQALVRHLALEHGREPLAQLLLAEAHMQAGEPAMALEVLDSIPAQATGLGPAQHIAHLRTVCHVVLGQDDLARSALQLAMSVPAGCALRSLSTWVRALGVPARKLRVNGSSATVEAYLGRLRAADPLLDKGRWGAALELLDHPALWRQQEVQGMARLAMACLQSVAPGGCLSLRQHRALAEFVELATTSSVWNGNRLGAANWSKARLDALVAQAWDWLGGPVKASSLAAGKRPDEGGRTPPSPALIITSVASARDASNRGVLIHKSETGPIAQRYVGALLDQAKGYWDAGRKVRLAGLILDPGVDVAPHYRVACEQLLGIASEGDAVAVAVPMAVVFEKLARWPAVFDAFLSQPVMEGPFSRFPLVYLRQDGAGFGNVT